MKKIILTIIFLSCSSWAYAGQGIGPGPGVKGYSGATYSKILVTPSGKVLVTSGIKWLKAPGTESWDKLMITANGTPLKTADNKLLKTP